MIKCPRCHKEVSELDDKCKYCGLVFEDYEQEHQEEQQGQETVSYVSGYNIFLCILGILILIGAIIIGQEEVSLAIICLVSGMIFLVILNMLKNIIEELRILNSKIK